MIELTNVSKLFKQPEGNFRVLDNLSFSVGKGEFISLFGPNGSGKTTLLNILAGLDFADSGSVLVNEKNPVFTRTGFVFQNYNESMLPWRTVLGNVELALENESMNREKRKRIAEEFLKKADLLAHKDKYFYQLSGGMKQLVAVCRAFAFNPNILLMDEPFSALDYSTTRKMELELLKIWGERKETTIFVSHDIDEAIFLADKVIVLSKRPARVKEIVNINLPRPRRLEMLSSKRFFNLRAKLLGFFENE